MNGTHWLRTVLLVVLSAACGGLVVLLVGVLVTLLRITGEIQTTQESNADTQEGNAQILEYIEDCTDPEGECRKQAEARDAAQVGAFNAVVIAANWCAELQPETYRELAACVGKILDGKGHK